MFRKKNIIATSVLISLILSNASNVVADDQSTYDLHNELPKETEVTHDEIVEDQPTSDSSERTEELSLEESDELSEQQQQVFNQIIVQLKDLLDEDQKDTLSVILKREKDFINLFSKAILLHDEEFYDHAVEVYEQLLEVNEITSNNEREFIQLLTSASRDKNHILDIEYMESVDSTKSVDNSNNINEPQNSEISLFSTQGDSVTKTSDEFYKEYQEAYYVSDLWEISQAYKTAYPNDSRIDEVVTHAAIENLEEGRRVHRRGETTRAIIYYDRVLSLDSIDDFAKQTASNLKNLAENKGTLKSATHYYKDYQEAYYVSDLWTISQNFKRYYHEDNRIDEVVNDAAIKNLAEGRRVHNRKDFNRAIIYYDRVIGEPLVNASLKKDAQNNKSQALKDKDAQKADELYEEYQKAYYVSDLWELSQLFKIEYPSDSRVSELINDAAIENLAEGRRVHNRKDFDRAIVYYERVMGESLVNNSLQSEAQKNKNQAIKDRDSQKADVLYEKYQEAYYVSDLWELSQKFKIEHPNDSRVNELINNAATENLAEGRRVHINGNYDRALVYYNRILNEPLIKQTLKSEAKVLKNLLENRTDIKTADDYYNEYQKATLVSTMWDISQEFKTVFPNDSRINQVVNHAASENLKEGRRVHNRGDFQKALIYYNRVLNEELVSSSYKKEAALYSKFADDNSKVKSANQYYSEYQKAYYVSDLWSISQDFKTAYPNDSRVNTLINDAAMENLKEGRRVHRNKNYSRASIYYNRIINEMIVKKSTRHLAEVYNKQTQAMHQPVIYIDPGHGGIDPGPVFNGVSEKTLNLNVSKYLQNELEAKGYKVVLSRETDRFVDLTPRAVEANNLGADIFVSVHHNSMGGTGAARGIETFIHHTLQNAQKFGQETNRNNFKDNPRIQDSLNLADHIHSNLIRSTGFYDRGVKGNNFNVLRNTYIPAVLLELGFMDNYTELSIIRTQSYQKKAAKAIAQGIDSYFKNIVK